MTTLKREQQISAAARKAERDRDAEQAMRDYETDKRAALTNMERLRELRLAKERADAEAVAKKSVKKSVKPSAKTTAAAK